MVKVSVIGLGFVGGSMKKSFELKGAFVKGYDKYKTGTDSFTDCLEGDIVFLALPTIFDEDKMSYDKSCIHEVCTDLEKFEYKGLVVIKSTVEPTTTEGLIKTYPTLRFIHNPEFLTAATAFEDFHNQKHIVLGKGSNISDLDVDVLEQFYTSLYPDAEVSRCSCTESESMKIFVNCFYSVKIQFFNELYLLCDKMGCDYNTVKNLMLKNKWINPMHTNVPGVDGKLSYGGYCFPKDTNALLSHMKREGTNCKVLEATIIERNIMRHDNVNIKSKDTHKLISGFDETSS
jgi:UDPglucose 6-dehydrogenase